MNKGILVAPSLALLTRIASTLGLAFAPVAASGLLASCADENDPMTWVKRLDDPKDRDQAVRRLGQFFESAMTKANQDRSKPEVKDLLDKIAEPLSKTYLAGVSDGTRKALMNQFVQMRDPRTQPALAKALADYEPGKNDEEVRDAAEAVRMIAKGGAKIEPATADGLWKAFEKLQISKARLSELIRKLHDAVLDVKDPSYGPKALAKLAVKVTLEEKPDSLRDQMEFWQLTSVQVIRELKYKEALPRLIATLLTPAKEQIHGAVRSALRAMPLESEAALIKAMTAPDGEIKEAIAAGDKIDTIKNKAYLAVLGDALTEIARPAGRDAVLELLKQAGDNQTMRYGLAQTLIHFPKDDRVVPAFKEAYEKIPADATVPFSSIPPKVALAQAAASLYDPTLVEWLIKESAKQAQPALRLVYLDSAAKIMTPAQAAMVDEAVKKVEAELTKDPKMKDAVKSTRDILAAMATPLTSCAENAECYVKVLDEPIDSKKPAANMRAVKAVYMAVIFAKDKAKVRDELVSRVPKITDDVLRVSLAMAVSALSPQGDVKAAEAFEKIVDSDAKAGTARGGNDALKKVADRLRARAAK